MARYHYQTRRDAERKYPHRVDIPVPDGGLGKQLNDMIAWCSERFTDWTHAGITDKMRRDSRGIRPDQDSVNAGKLLSRLIAPDSEYNGGMVEFDPSKLSNLAADKLQAVLNHDWEGAGNYLPKEYLAACAEWYESLSVSNKLVATIMLVSHSSGDVARALTAAGELPPAPKFPLR